MPCDRTFESPSTIKMSALFYSDQNRLGKSRILKKNMTKLLKAGEEDSKFLEIIAVEVGRIRTVFMYVLPFCKFIAERRDLQNVWTYFFRFEL